MKMLDNCTSAVRTSNKKNTTIFEKNNYKKKQSLQNNTKGY